MEEEPTVLGDHKETSPRPSRARAISYLLVGRSAQVETTFADGDTYETTEIVGSRERPNEYRFDQVAPPSSASGTVVTIQARQVQQVARIADDAFLANLTARLAATLLALTDVSVLYRGQKVDPTADMARDPVELTLEVDQSDLHGHPQPKIVLVRWTRDMQSKNLFLCDEHGAVVTEQPLAKLPPAPIHWSAYLRWDGFRDPDLMSLADLHNPDVRHGTIIHG